MPSVLPNIPQEPAQGIQALLDTVYLWNPDVANGLIDKVNELLEELGELSNISGAIKPYSQLEAPVRQYMPMSYNDGVYVANEEMTTLPATPDLSKWTLIATKVDEQAIEAVVAGEAETRAAADSALQGAIREETLARQAADNNLQTQIDAISAASDVTDIVGTHAELENYDTSTLSDNDIIKVLRDETQEDATTYYRWVAAEDEFQLIGEEGPYYTKAQTDTLLDAKQDIMQFETMPEADASNANKVIQYVGEDIPESKASAVATQTIGSSLTDLSVNVDTFVETEQPSGSETVSFVAAEGNKEIIGDTTGYLGPNRDVELTITNPSAFVEKAKNAWDAQFGEQYGYFEDVVDGFIITAMGDTNLGINVVREIDCVIGGSSYAVAPVFPDASEWYLQVAPTPTLDGEWGIGFDLGKNVTWSKNGTTVDLADYGVTYSGTPVGGDTISVAYTPEVVARTKGYFYISAPVLEPAQATVAQTAGAHGTTIETSIAYTWQDEPTNPPVNYVIDAQALYDAMDSKGWTGSIETFGFSPETSSNYFQYDPNVDGGTIATPNGGWLYGYTDSIISFPDGAPSEVFHFYTRNFQYAHELTNLSVDVDAFIAAEQPTGDTTVDFVATVYNEFQLSPTSFEVEGGTLTVDPATFLQAYRNNFGDPDNVYLFEVEVQAGDFHMLVYYTNGDFDAWIDPAEFGFSYTGDLSELTTTTICNINCTEPGVYWYKNGSLVDIVEYGISYGEVPEDGDTITVTYVAPFVSGYAWEQINVQPGGAGGIKWAGQWDKPASTTWSNYYPHYIFPTLPDGNYELTVQSKSLYQYSSGVPVWSYKTFKIAFGVNNHRARGIATWVLDGNTDFWRYNLSSTAYFTHWSSYYDPTPLDRITTDDLGACRISNSTVRMSEVGGVFRWTNIKNTDTGEEIPVETEVLQYPEGQGNQIGNYNSGAAVNPPSIPTASTYFADNCNDSKQYIFFANSLLPVVNASAHCGSFKIVLKDADGSEWHCVVENNMHSYVARVLKASGIFVNAQLGWADGDGLGTTCVFLNTPAGTDKTIEAWVSLYGNTVSADCWMAQSVSNFTPVLVTRPGSLVTVDNFGLIEQYTGETDANYTNGYFYKATGTKVDVPESITTTTVSPAGEATVTIDLANWIDAVAETYGWTSETVRSWLTEYVNTVWNLSYNVDSGEVTRMYLPWYGDTNEQNILQYVTVDYTGSQEGEVWVEFQEQYTKAHTEIQNGRWERIDVQPAPEALPDQTGNAGKFLTTNGTDASWGNNTVGLTVTAEEPLSASVARKMVSFRGTDNSEVGSISARTSGIVLNATNSYIGIGCNGHFAPTANGGYDLGYNFFGTITKWRTVYTGKISNGADIAVPTTGGTMAVQVSSLPTAGSALEGQIYQFVGATDSTYTNGHFYKCVSDGADPAAYSWEEVSLGGGSSYTAGNGISITNNEISVTAPVLTNIATGQSSYGIGNPGGSYPASITGNFGVGVGSSVRVSAINGVAIGASAGAEAASGVAIGPGARVQAAHAIQISAWEGGSWALNNTPNTVNIHNGNTNYRVLSADGTIPTARLTKVNTTVTLAVADWSSNTQTVSVTGVTAGGVVLVSPTPANQSAYTSAGILCTAQAAGSLTFTCDTVPSADITVTIVML